MNLSLGLLSTSGLVITTYPKSIAPGFLIAVGVDL